MQKTGGTHNKTVGFAGNLQARLLHQNSDLYVEEQDHNMVAKDRFDSGSPGATRQIRSPGIFNSDQGVQYTSPTFLQPLKDAGVKISRNGKGRVLDNVFVTP